MEKLWNLRRRLNLRAPRFPLPPHIEGLYAIFSIDERSNPPYNVVCFRLVTISVGSRATNSILENRRSPEIMIISIKKRDGRVVPFDPSKIEHAIAHCFMGSGSQKSDETAQELCGAGRLSVGKRREHPFCAFRGAGAGRGGTRADRKGLRAFCQGVHSIPRRTQPRARDEHPPDADVRGHHVQQGRRRLATSSAKTPTSTATPPWAACSSYGSEGAKQFYEMYVLEPALCRRRIATATSTSTTWTFYTLTTTCCQIDLLRAVPRRLLHRSRRAARAQRHLPAMPRWPASPFRPTRTTSTAARAS